MDMLALDGIGLMTQWLWPILQFLIGLGLVILVHELGHFLAAKWSGIKVEELSVGFGPRLVGFRRGETDYGIKALPLGGYVRMLGQEDFKPQVQDESDPRAWQNRPVSRRLAVLAAGVVMNTVFAALVFVIVYLVGIRFAAPVIGDASPGSPAATVKLPKAVAQAMGEKEAVGLAPGDRVLAINGVKTRTYDQILMAGLLSGPEETFRFTVARNIGGKEITFDVTLQPRRVEGGPEGTHYAFGILRPSSAVIDAPAQAGYAGGERFQSGDRVREVSGVTIEHPWDIAPVLKTLTGRQVDVVVSRKGRNVTVPVQPCLYSKDGQEMLNILGMSPRIVVGNVDKGSPADKAGLKPGDVIVDYADMGTPSHAELLELNAQLIDQPTHIAVLRQGTVVDLTIKPREKEVPGPQGAQTRALIGINPLPEQAQAYVADVGKGSPADKGGVIPGSVITEVNGVAVGTWPEVYNALKAAAGSEVTLTYQLGSTRRMARIGPLTADLFDPGKYTFSLVALEFSAMEVLRTPPVRGSPLEALAWSARDTRDFIARTYLTLTRLAERRVSPKALRGPVGIGEAYIIIAREDLMHVVYLTAMLSVIVAVINFLPLPALDGGLALLTVIEKVRGRPLPMKFQAGFQVAGLVLFLGLFLALTWNDISRLLPKW